MSNSPLVTYTRISPNRTVMSNKKNTHIVIHHMAGNLTVEQCGAVFAPSSRQASSNYGVDGKGHVGLYCSESDRAWTTGSREIDCKAVTIEVADDEIGGNWHVSDTALQKTIDLCVDICKRNGIKELRYTGDKSGNLHKHQWYQNTNCLPINTELLTKNGWVKLSDIEIGDEVACADLDNLNISFEEVYDKVLPKQQDTYTNNGLTATKDHRMVYRTQSNNNYRIDFFNKLLEKSPNKIFIPLAGKNHFKGLPFTEDMEAFLIAVQADGCYMYEKTKNNEIRYYGVEFHFSKERKINRIKNILNNLHFNYSEKVQSNGTVKIRIYNQDDINIVMDICEKYLNNKHFTWTWINMSPEQAKLFLDEIMEWDGCFSGNKYSSNIQINLDIVNAIAALNNVGSRVIGSDVLFRNTSYMSLSTDTKRNNKRGSANTEVSCVSVKTGLILIRQNGKTFITGNCPGQYLGSKFPYIASEVTKRLRGSIEPDLIVDGYDYSKVYDYNYYINKYTDIKNTFGDDKVATFNHFITNGMREARQAISNFNVGIYKDNYKDLQKAFGSDLPKYYQHYIKYGINEKRIADYHIVPVTVKDGVDYSPVYDGVYYVNKYADLKKAFGNNYDKLLNHFIQYGMKEKRQAISSFNVEIYKNNYQDLQVAYGNDYPQYYIHYIKWGKKEGRVADHAIRQVEVKYHTFQDGDTVSKIATQYKTTVDDILKLNNIKWTTGQKIRVQ